MPRKTAFFEGWSWFKFNNLGLELGTNLKFYTSLSKGLKLNVCRSYRRKTGRGGGLPPCWIGLKVVEGFSGNILLVHEKSRHQNRPKKLENIFCQNISIKQWNQDCKSLLSYSLKSWKPSSRLTSTPSLSAKHHILICAIEKEAGCNILVKIKL